MSHPLRRVSTGSLSALARSQDHPPPTSSASGLDFLTSAMLDLSDEAATLSSHLTSMNKLHHELGVFNEAFAGYLYALRLNAFCVEWTEAPDEASFKRSAELTSQVSSSTTLPTAQPTHQDADSTVPGDLTYATVYSSGDTSHQANVRDEASPRRPASRGSSRGRGGGNSGIPRATTTASSRGRGGSVAGTGRSSTSSATVTPTSAAAPRPTTLAERKKRDAVIAGIIDTLPIEFRGGDPTTRQSMEKVLIQLMQHPDGRKLGQVVGATNIPQPKVNKCLIALVGRKVVSKAMVAGVTVYTLNPL